MIRKICFRLWLFWELTVKIWWHKKAIEKNEFHGSLTMNLEKINKMNGEEKKMYCERLATTRLFAHDKTRIKSIKRIRSDITDSHC